MPPRTIEASSSFVAYLRGFGAKILKSGQRAGLIYPHRLRFMPRKFPRTARFVLRSRQIRPKRQFLRQGARTEFTLCESLPTKQFVERPALCTGQKSRMSEQKAPAFTGCRGQEASQKPSVNRRTNRSDSNRHQPDGLGSTVPAAQSFEMAPLWAVRTQAKPPEGLPTGRLCLRPQAVPFSPPTRHWQGYRTDSEGHSFH